jgi:uncharacterized protein (TIGR02246 family)
VNADAIAADFLARWQAAWNSDGANAAAALYTEDAVLVGASIAVGRDEIARRLALLHGTGWTRIAIRLVNARRVGDLVLAAAEFTATGSGANEGKLLDGRSSHSLTKVGEGWLSAMHAVS